MFEELYRHRFDEKELRQKIAIWKILCSYFFQRYISKGHSVLDIGAGYCEFINNIRCAERYAVDIDKDIYKYANPEVKTFNCSCTNLSFMPDNYIDVVFLSNLLEHLKTKDEILKTLSEGFRVLKQGGVIIILGPNIRYCHKKYWDFFDHCIPLSDKSLIEALEISGFKTERVLPKFLLYTTKNSLAFTRNQFFVRVYLLMPFIWRFFGKQMFILARKPA